MSEDLTHYDVLGVDPSADKDAIKNAYQARLSEVQADVAREQGAKKPDEASLEGYKREEARVRSAWQVLSDPYQRGRYDATVELGGGDVDADDDEYEDDGDADRTPARTSARGRGGRDRGGRRPPPQRPPGMFSPTPLPTPSTWPAGVSAPPPRARTMALIIDLFVLFLLWNGLSIAGTSYVENQYPKETKTLEHIVDCYDKLQTEGDKDKPKIARVEKIESSNDCQLSKTEFATGENNASDRIDKDTDRLKDKHSNVSQKRSSAFLVVQLVTILILLLYLVPYSIISGRTLGKRLMQIRAINQDGTPLGFRGAMLRYGIPVVAAMFLGTFLGAAIPAFQSFAFIIVLFAVMSWPRNPNLQGMHDRIAKTIVVDG